MKIIMTKKEVRSNREMALMVMQVAGAPRELLELNEEMSDEELLSAIGMDVRVTPKCIVISIPEKQIVGIYKEYQVFLLQVIPLVKVIIDAAKAFGANIMGLVQGD